jgi:hypothetical protein
MVNGSFVFGMDADGPDVFDRTVAWAIEHGVETATFHILTPYPDTALFERMQAEGRVLHRDWDLYDTRHVVFRPARMDGATLEAGYWRAYRDFYRWGSIWRGAASKPSLRGRARHLAYAGGWKKFEPMWDLLIRTGRVLDALPLLETILTGFGRYRPAARAAGPHEVIADGPREAILGASEGDVAAGVSGLAEPAAPAGAGRGTGRAARSR